MPIAKLDKRDIWYTITGSGEPLVQLHGAALGHRNFSRVTPVLAQHFRVIDFDMVGFGDSSPLPDHYGLRDWTEDLRDLIDFLGLQTVHLHGTSTGGLVALDFAARYPERVDRLVLVGVMARPDGTARLIRRVSKEIARRLGMATLAEFTASQAFTRRFLDSVDAPPVLEAMGAAFKATRPAAYLRFSEVVETVDLSQDLPRITAPCLVVSGELSQLSPVETGPTGMGARELAARVQHGRLEIIPGCGHLVLVERFQEVCTLLVDFLQASTSALGTSRAPRLA